MVTTVLLCLTIGGCPPMVASDTPHVRRHAVEVSDWYARRLSIHRGLSYAVIPLFAGEWVAGNQILVRGRDAPTWAKTSHRAIATTLAGVFGVNTVTGLWNLWDSRGVEPGRALRTTHAIMMLAADGGFAYAGHTLANRAENDVTGTVRRQHRTWALASIGVTVTSATMMKVFNK
jgi:hypothetical protein